MKKNRCFKLTALLLAITMMISIIPSFALGDVVNSEGSNVDGIPEIKLNSTFVTSEKILDAGKKEVMDLSAADPNGSFTLNLKVEEPVDAVSDEEKLPPDTSKVIMYYHMENMTAESGGNDDISWTFDAEAKDLVFKWKGEKKTSFEASIKIYPNYPAVNDISGSYVLGTARKSMLGTRAFRDTDKNRDKLFASVYTETSAGIRPATDENPVWVIEHYSGDYYTLRAQNTNKYIYISPAAKGSYKGSSLYLVEGTRETAQKILVTDVGGGYYSFTYKHTDNKKYAINNSSNDKEGNSAVRGFGCWEYQGFPNEIFKLYSPSALINSATIDLSGTWNIANTSGKLLLTSEASKANRLAGMKYTLDNDIVVSENEAVAFTFERVIRDWYTVRTDAGYLNITKDGATISSNPQRLLVLSDDNYASIILATSEYLDSSEKFCATYALNCSGEFGTVISRINNNTRMQLILPSNSVNGQTRALLFFNVNGGTATETPSAIIGETGEKIVLPDLNGTKNSNEFIGWCDVKSVYSKNPGTNHTYHEVYKPGTSYTLKSGSNTLYAIYNEKGTKKVRFGIRKDGIIQDEPNGYDVKNYIGHFEQDLSILKESHWVIDIDSTKPVNGYYVVNDIIANLNWVPSAEEIAEALMKEGKVEFDPETQYIHYYVMKCIEDTTWKIDGVIRNKEKVSVTYNANVPGAEKTLIKSMPGGAQVVVGSEILIGTNAGSTEVLKPTREGYVFNGWNTEPDGSGTSYSEGHYVKLTGNLNLYAQWVRSDEGQLIIKIESDWPAGKPAYEGTEITLTAKLTGFEGKEYTLQWQYSTDLENWIDEPGANNITFTYIMNETTATYTWRVIAKDIH